MPGPEETSRIGRCHQASFSAENTMITIVPSFNYDSDMPLLSCPSSATIGPFIAGMPIQVPLWMAKLLHQRHLAQIHLPDWLSSAKLIELLRLEKEHDELTNELPFYYFEIARSLNMVMDRPTQVVLQDLMSFRVDKLRHQFNEMVSKEILQAGQPLPTIELMGIGSVELQLIGPFMKRAFSDYVFLRKSGHAAQGGVGDEDFDEEANDLKTPAANISVKRPQLQARLRRFRD